MLSLEFPVSHEEPDWKRIESRWKSDVDLKLDRVVRFIDTYEDYLKLCLERELDKRLLRKAIIEKSLAGIIWSALILTAIAMWDYIKIHARAP